jgi:large subunit ribosomal protein L16
MLSPKKLKYRKPQRGTMGGQASRGTEVAFGEYGLQSIGGGWITAREIEAARRAMTRPYSSRWPGMDPHLPR